MHSYTFPEHEVAIGQLAKEMGFTHVSLSSQVMPMVRIVPRGYTGNALNVVLLYCIIIIACADAYLTPSIQRYVQGFISGFKNPVSIPAGAPLHLSFSGKLKSSVHAE